MRSLRASGQAGAGLVEMLVALAIGLLVSIVALGSAQTFSGVSRLQSGQGSALAAAASAMDALRHDVQLSGLGFYSDGQALCDRINLAFNGVIISDSASFQPLRITRGAGGSDQVEMVYARDVTSGVAFRLLAPMTQPMGAAVLGAGAGALAGYVVLMASPATGAPRGGATPVWGGVCWAALLGRGGGRVPRGSQSMNCRRGTVAA